MVCKRDLICAHTLRRRILFRSKLRNIAVGDYYRRPCLYLLQIQVKSVCAPATKRMRLRCVSVDRHTISLCGLVLVRGRAQLSALAGIKAILFAGKRALFCVSILCTRIFLRRRIFLVASAQFLCVALSSSWQARNILHRRLLARYLRLQACSFLCTLCVDDYFSWQAQDIRRRRVRDMRVFISASD